MTVGYVHMSDIPLVTEVSCNDVPIIPVQSGSFEVKEQDEFGWLELILVLAPWQDDTRFKTTRK